MKLESFSALLAGFFIVTLLVGCSPSATSTPSPVLTTLAASPTATLQSPDPEIDHLTVTPSLPCTTDLCIHPGDFPLSRPIRLPGNNRVEGRYRYGYTQSGVHEPHHGVEFPNPQGTPVQAAADGTVIIAGNDSEQVFGEYPGFYGNLVLLKHSLPGYSTPVYTLYAHLSSIAARTGQEVSRGDTIGAVGLSGTADGAHLHFEVRLGEPDYDHTANPELFLAPLASVDTSAPSGILIGRIEDATGAALKTTVSVQPLDLGGLPKQATYPELYGYGVPPSPEWDENFLVADLPAGKYRIAFVAFSKVFEQTVEVIPGDITFVKITAKP